MRKSVRKFIALTAAAASIINASAMGVNAGYVAEKVGDSGFDSLIEKRNQNIYFNDVQEGSELVVIGKDGTKETVSLDEAINGIYSFVSVSPVQYNYICPTPEAYGYNFSDPNYILDPEADSMIVGIGDKFAVMHESGKIVSEKYDNIYRINDDYFEVVNYNKDKRTCGVIDTYGRPIISESEDIAAVYLTNDGNNFLIVSDNGDYFADLDGHRVTDRYTSIHFFRNDGQEGQKFWTSSLVGNGMVGYQKHSTPASYDMDFVIPNSLYVFEQKNLMNNSYYAPVYGIGDPKSFDYPTYRVMTDSNVGFTGILFDGSNQSYYDLNGKSIENKSFISHNYDPEKGIDYWIADIRNKEDVLYTDKFELYDSELNLKFSGSNIEGLKDKFVVVNDGLTVYDTEFNAVKKIDEPVNNGIVLNVNDNTDEYQITTGNYYKIPKEKKSYFVVIEDGKNTVRVYDDELSSYTDVTFSGLPEGSEVTGLNNYNSYSNEITVRTDDENYTYFINDDLKTTLVSGLSSPVKLNNEYICADNTRDGGFTIYNYDGEAVKDIDCWSLNKVYFMDDGQLIPYFVTHDRSHEHFSVYDSNFELVAENIEGDWDGQYYVKYDFDNTSGYNFNDTAYDKYSLRHILKKYGLFTPEKGVVLEPVNDNVVYQTQFSDLEVNENTQHLNFIFVVNDGKTSIYNENMELVQEWDGEYAFEPITNGAYNSTITFNYRDPGNETTSTKVYDPFNNEVVYEQSGKYDYVSTFRDGYAMTFIFDPNENDKDISRIRASAGKQGIIRSDGSELIKPIDLYSLMIKSGDHINSIYGYSNTGYLENYVGEGDNVYINSLWIPVEDIDYAFAEANNLQFAYKLETGEYIVCGENGLWGIYSKDGKVLAEPKYGFINRFNNGIAVVNGYEDDESAIGIIGRDGRIFAECKTGTATIGMNDVYYVEEGIDPETSIPEKTYSLCGKDYYNEFTEKYGYDKAVESRGLYIVTKGGLTGIVDADNNEVVPLEYKEVLYLNDKEQSWYNAREGYREVLANVYTSPVKMLANGKRLVNLRDANGKITPYLITSDEYNRKKLADMPENVGDLNGDTYVNAEDASKVLALYTKISTQADYALTDEEKDLADVNGDNVITAEDASTILAYYSYSSTFKDSGDFRTYLKEVSIYGSEL